MHNLLMNSRGFLGNKIFLEFWFLLFASADDSTAVVRVSGRSVLRLLSKREKKYDQWVHIHAEIIDRWLVSIKYAAKLIEMACGGSSVTGLVLNPSMTDVVSSTTSAVNDGIPATTTPTPTPSAVMTRTHNSLMDTFSNIDAKLLHSLSTAVGCGIILGRQLELTVFANRQELISCLQVMFTPDLDSGVKSMALASKRYYFPIIRPFNNCSHDADIFTNSSIDSKSIDSKSFVDVGYYRISLLGTRQEVCLSATRRLVGWVVSRSMLANLVDYATISLRKMQHFIGSYSNDKPNHTTRKQRDVHMDSSSNNNNNNNNNNHNNNNNYNSSTQLLRTRTQELRSNVALWLLLSTAVASEVDIDTAVKSSKAAFHHRNTNASTAMRDANDSSGSGRIGGDDIEKSSKLHQQQQCAQCGSLSSKQPMSRCSRCKSSFYCCLDHQKLHWSVHKVR